MSSQYEVVVRRLSASKRTVDAQRRSGRLDSVYRGIYLPKRAENAERAWLNHLSARIERAGPGSAASHRAAARIHGLDGFDRASERYLDVIAPMHSTLRPPDVMRSRTLTADDVIAVDSLPVTSLERTLCDLGRKVSAPLLEIAVESALRGSSPTRPYAWNHELLTALDIRCAAHLPHTGIRPLRNCLAQRRLGALPTGSYAETLALQALRASGFTPWTQARIHISAGGRTQTYWADFADLERGLVMEIDGLEGHGSPAAQDRDHHRQNIITEALTMMRFSASAVLNTPATVVSAVLRRRAHLGINASSWVHGGFHIQRMDDGWEMTRVG